MLPNGQTWRPLLFLLCYSMKILSEATSLSKTQELFDIKKMCLVIVSEGYMEESGYQENESPDVVSAPLPDMTLPLSFDGDNTVFRYRSLESTSQFLTRPVLDMNSWDQDCGYDGLTIENSLALAEKFPASFGVQVSKDKNDFNIQFDSSIAAKHREKVSSMAGFDIQSIGKQLAYILRGETKFKNFKRNETCAACLRHFSVKIYLLD